LICKPLFKPLAKKPPNGAIILAKIENTAAWNCIGANETVEYCSKLGCKFKRKFGS
jgi:hypothetical protein